MSDKIQKIIIDFEEEKQNDYSHHVVRKYEQCNMLKACYTTPLHNRRPYDDRRYTFTTKDFSCKNNKSVLWALELSENSDSDSNYASLTIYLKGSEFSELEVFFKGTLRKASEKIKTVETLCSFSLPTGKSMIIPNFVKSNVISSKKLNNFRLSCKIYALPKQSLFVQKKQLAIDLYSLLKEQTLTDVTLIASGKELRAHKAILAARSPVFAKMFHVDMREKRESQVRIDDVDYEVMSAFLKFAYTAQLEVHYEGMAGALIVAAEKYQFDQLKQASANLLLRRLNVSNAIDTLQLAERYNFAELKTKIIEFINHHAKDIVKTPAFKKLSSTQAHLIAEIYSVMAMALNNDKSIVFKRLGSRY